MLIHVVYKTSNLSYRRQMISPCSSKVRDTAYPCTRAIDRFSRTHARQLPTCAQANQNATSHLRQSGRLVQSELRISPGPIRTRERSSRLGEFY